jgi:prepilin-type N-terminal cleavage/methylation domain-containing protein
MSVRRNGFTLIELLIVVAIIAILAAIAVPNFLEAQTRAKVSRVHADLRSIGIANEAYCVDKGAYACIGPLDLSDGNAHQLVALTTPVSYITRVHIKDPFYIAGQGTAQVNKDGYFQYECNNQTPTFSGPLLRKCFIIFSFGPDRRCSSMGWMFIYLANGEPLEQAMYKGLTGPNGYDGIENGALIYDPTNGTKSQGDIGRTGGDAFGVPTVLGGGAH